MQKKTKPPVDKTFLILTLLMLLIGSAMLWSASTVEAQKNFGNTNYYILRALAGIGIGLTSMYLVSRIDYHFWKKIIPFGLLVALLALIAVKIPGIGFSANGATRWISIGPLFFQPAEPAKLAIILYVAGLISNATNDVRRTWKLMIPPICITAIFGGLIMWQPDMGSTLSIIAVVFGLLFIAGARLRHLGILAGIGVVLLGILIKLEPYRMRRITAFLDPSADPLNTAYQINQAILAIGSGGFFGYGYGASRQKFSYLPETLNDSIFAVVAEELGFLRVTGILVLFTALIIRGIQITHKAPDLFGKMLAGGIIISLSTNLVINVGAITGLLPLTGIPLPFFSYGSSAMVINLASLGILLNISRYSSK